MCLLFHDMLCCVTAAAWSLSLFVVLLLLLLLGKSHPTLTYVSASDVLIYYCPMLLTVLTHSQTLLLPVIHLNAPILCPNLCLSPSHFMSHPHHPTHARTSWVRSTAHWERLWAPLPVAWRNRLGECSFTDVQLPRPTCPISSRSFPSVLMKRDDELICLLTPSVSYITMHD